MCCTLPALPQPNVTIGPRIPRDLSEPCSELILLRVPVPDASHHHHPPDADVISIWEGEEVFRERQESINSGENTALLWVKAPTAKQWFARNEKQWEEKDLRKMLEKIISIFFWREQNSSTMTQMLNKCKVQQDIPEEVLIWYEVWRREFKGVLLLLVISTSQPLP